MAGGSKTLCALNLPERVVGGLVAAPSGTLPLNPAQMRSLFEVFWLMTDPRTGGAEFRIGGVLTLTAMAILCGACDISQIARFATRLRPKQRAHLGMPRKTGTQAFYRVPSYSVFYQVLKRMDAGEFARRLCSWLQAAAGTLPGALALDGKTIAADALHCQIRDCPAYRGKGGRLPAPNQSQSAQASGARTATSESDAPPFCQSSPGHGRADARPVALAPLEAMECDFPLVRSLLIIGLERHIKKSGRTSFEVRCSLSSHKPGEVAGHGARALGRSGKPQP